MAHEKRLLIDVFQAYFYRKDKDGKRNLVFMSENLTSGGITTSQENTDVRNGQGNTLFAVLPGTKDVTVNLTENVFSFEALELNTGGEVGTVATNGVVGNSGLILKRPGKYEMQENKQVNNVAGFSLIELKYAPQNPEELVVTIGNQEFTYEATAAGVAAADKFTLAKQTAGAGDFAEWDKASLNANDKLFLAIKDAKAAPLKTTADLKILPYVYITRNGGKVTTLTIDSRKFAEGGELWLQTIEKDEKQKATAYVYFVFENAMPEGNFEISTVSEVQPNDMSVSMRILANEDGELYRIVREEI